jgi:hypothetical protein
MKLRRWRALLAIATVTACDPGSGVPVDAGSDVGTDAAPPLPVVGEAIGRDRIGDADYSCAWTSATVGVPGAEGDIPFGMRLFANGDSPPLDTVCVFGDGAVPGSDCLTGCAAPISAPTDTTAISLRLATGSWANVCATTTMDGYLPVLAIHRHVGATAGAPLVVDTINQGQLAGILAFFDTVPSTEPSATLGGQVVDCAGHNVFGAQIRVLDEAGNLLDQTSDPGLVIGFFDDTIPAPDARVTDGGGLVGIGNLRAGERDHVRVETWGVREAGGEATPLGCEWVPIRAGAFTNVILGPGRIDYATDDPCRRP